MQVFALTEPDYMKAGTGTILKPLGEDVGLPGVRCPACGMTWIDPLAAMPFVDIPADDPLRKRKPGPVPLDEFRRCCEHVRTVCDLEPGVTFRPTCSFGVRDYWSKKPNPAVFQFPDIGQMLVHESVLELLKSNKITGWRARPVAVSGPFLPENAPRFSLLEVTGSGGIVCTDPPFQYELVCTECGRSRYTPARPATFALDEEQWDGTDMFRFQHNFTGRRFVTERLADLLRNSTFTNYELLTPEELMVRMGR